MPPPVLRIGPGPAQLMVWSAALEAASATPGAPNAVSAISETKA